MQAPANNGTTIDTFRMTAGSHEQAQIKTVCGWADTRAEAVDNRVLHLPVRTHCRACGLRIQQQQPCANLARFFKAFANDSIQSAAINSLIVATCATVVATTLATFAALAIARGGPFRGRGVATGVITLPLIVPEIATAVATLSFFGVIGFQLGLLTIIIAHTVFCIPFAYLPIRARLEGMNESLEQAAGDLYATPWQAFRHVTLPLLLPGIIAGAMLAFIISIDDVIITMMVSGAGSTTLPLYIYGMIRQGITPEVNVISTVMLLISIVFISIYWLLTREDEKTAH